MSYGRHGGPPRADARQAAVLVLLYQLNGQWHVPLTRRQAHLTQHAGQISLPGGAAEPGETLAGAALREASEELGIDSRQIRLLGTLSPVYVFNSNFHITPWVGATAERPEFQPCQAEVAELIELPLQVLLQPERATRTVIRRGGLELSAPCIMWQTTPIWGATHVMLGQLARVLQTRFREGREGEDSAEP
jgi:8-oxo-dGTP pyrophosphatase MutT (NUDIX family)